MFQYNISNDSNGGRVNTYRGAQFLAPSESLRLGVYYYGTVESTVVFWVIEAHGHGPTEERLRTRGFIYRFVRRSARPRSNAVQLLRVA